MQCVECGTELTDERYEVDGRTLCREHALIPGSRGVYRGVKILMGEKAQRSRERAMESLAKMNR